MRSKHYLMLWALLIISCGPIKELGGTQNNTPSLGTIGKEHKSILNKNFEQIGSPKIEEGITISVLEIPFTKSEFKTYVQYKKGRGEESNLVFIDSIASKPEYLKLNISDKINLLTQLNNESNSNVRSYLANDEEYAIVTEISLLANENLTDRLKKAEHVFLVEDNNGLLILEILESNQRTLVKWSDLEIFDYGLSGFSSCPKGTEKKPSKLNDIKPYLKL